MAAQKANVDRLIALTPMSLSYGETLRAQLKYKVDQETYNEAIGIIDTLEKGWKPKSVATELAGLFNDENMPFLISAMKYTPKTEAAKLTLPILFVSGQNDLQVSPAWVKALAESYKKGKYVEIKNMNHILKNAPKDAEANYETYTQPDLPLAPELIEKILSFL